MPEAPANAVAIDHTYACFLRCYNFLEYNKHNEVDFLGFRT